MEHPLLEKLSELEHEQWVVWSKALADEVGPERRRRWEAMWIPYSQLTETLKEVDRQWARKVLAALAES